MTNAVVVGQKIEFPKLIENDEVILQEEEILEIHYD